MAGGTPSKRKIMNTTTQEATATLYPDPPTVITKNDSNRCQYHYANGKRCRLAGAKPHLDSVLTISVSATPAPFNLPAMTRKTSPPSFSPNFPNATPAINLNQFLARLLALVTQGRISPRRAAVLSYITNQLIHSRRHRA